MLLASALSPCQEKRKEEEEAGDNVGFILGVDFASSPWAFDFTSMQLPWSTRTGTLPSQVPHWPVSLTC